MTKILSTMRLLAIGLPLGLAGCDLVGGGTLSPPTSAAAVGSAPISAIGQTGGGTQNGLSGGAEGGATQAGVGVGGTAAAGPGNESNPPVAGTGGAP